LGRNPENPKILLIKILTILTGLLVRNPENQDSDNYCRIIG
jgi:hypothetical protein